MDPSCMTRVVAGPEGAREAAALLRAGDIVAVPTETVYGLAGNALDPNVVGKIFEAKGRPSDNPLIVHVSDFHMVQQAARNLSPAAHRLMQAFWPGPLSLVLERSAAVPKTVTAGLDTVAVRMPAHPAVLAVLQLCGLPLAAPSANLSGRPSPTAAEHVLSDLEGRIPLILDGGRCEVGVESTVIDVTGSVPVILRPGAVTQEMIERVAGRVRIHEGISSTDAPPASPGMKYTHYAPDARVLFFEDAPDLVAEKIVNLYDTLQDNGERPLIMCMEHQVPKYLHMNIRSLGEDSASAEHALFSELRGADERGYTVVLFDYDPRMGGAVRNRITKAAGSGASEQAAQP